jgi:ankyrin repeat protein
LISTLFSNQGQNPGEADVPFTKQQLITHANLLLDQGDEIDARHPLTNHTPLSLAVSQGHVELVELLLKRGASTLQNDPQETRPLLIAEQLGFQPIIKLLKARMNRWQLFGWQRAIENEDIELAKELLERNERHSIQCLQKFRKDGTWYLVDPLCEVARRNSIPLAVLILKDGRNPNSTYGQGQYNGEVHGAQCLAWAASDEMRKLLIESGADPATVEGLVAPHLDEKPVPFEETTDDLGMQWQLAIESRDENQVRDLLTEHPHLSRQVIMDRWRDGRMARRSLDPLYVVAQSGHLGMVKQMIEAGYDKSKLKGAFQLAAPEVAAFLLDQGVDAHPNVGLMAYIAEYEALEFWLKRGSETPVPMLHNACCGRGRLRGHEYDDRKGWPETFRKTVRVLLDAGADVNARMAGGNQKYDGCKPWVTNRETPLHFAAGNWDPELVRMLLDAGADKTLTNDLGETPYDWAVKFEAPVEVLQLLSLETKSPE